MNDAVVVAVITAVPATLAALGAWRSAAAGRRVMDRVDVATNHQPADSPTLVEMVGTIGADVCEVKRRVGGVEGRLGALEKKVG